MIAAWMAYALVVGVVVAGAAYLLERAARLARLPARWVWVGALALLVGAVGVAPRRGVAPHWKVRVDAASIAAPPDARAAAATATIGAVLRDLQTLAAAPIERAVRAARAAVPAGADRWLGGLWLALSVGALGTMAAVLLRFHRARAVWPRAELQGGLVRVAPEGGPAVIGIARPEIVVPRWLLGCTAEEQRLVLAHEREHLRARDHLLLVAGCLTLALMPWHPAVWWMLSRLRLTVELDCDARVLRGGAAPHSYGSLLIDLAGRCRGLPIGALALADESTHLEQRLLAMKPTTVTFASLRGASFAALALVALVAACEARLPTAPEVERMDVAAAEAKAKGTLLLAPDSGNVLYMVDGVVSSEKVARALTPEQIAAIEVERGGGERVQSKVNITTREFIEAHDMPGDSTRDHFRIRVPGPTAEAAFHGESGPAKVAIRRFDGLVVVDGDAVTEDVMAKIDPQRILSVEVIKGDAAAKLYPGLAAATRGVIRITTKR